VILFLVALAPIRLDDVFLYMTFGRMLVNNGGFGTTDPLIFSIPDHHWQLWHEWLSYLIYYFANWIAGFEGLIVLRALLVTAIGFLVWRLAYRVGLNPLIRMALLASALYAASPRAFRDRSSAFTDLFVVILLYLLTHPRVTAQGSKLKWFIPFLFLVWMQLHSLYLVGWFLLGLFVLANLYSWDQRSRRDWILVMALSVVVTIINPEAVDGVLWPIRAIFQPDWGPIGQITEFQPTLTAEFLDRPYKVFAALFMALTILVSALSIKQKGFFPLLVAITLTLFGLRYVRMMSMTSFGCALLIAFCLPGLISHWRIRWPKAMDLTARILALGLVVWLCISDSRGLGFLLKENPLHASVPERAVDFLKTLPPGHIFNGWELGGYLAWELDGRQKIAAHGFISDPRLVEKHIYRATVAREGWDEIVLRGGVEYVFLRRQIFEESRQAAWIRELEGPLWRPIFVDGAAVIFQRIR
jgi:hypothetical protein